MLGNDNGPLVLGNGPHMLSNGPHVLIKYYVPCVKYYDAFRIMLHSGICSSRLRHLGLCHIRDYVIRNYVAFGLMSFEIMSFGLMLFMLMFFGFMSFGIMSVSQNDSFFGSDSGSTFVPYFGFGSSSRSSHILPLKTVL